MIDATGASAPAQAGALAGFLADGLLVGIEPGAAPDVTAGKGGQTIVFYEDRPVCDATVALAPTADVRTIEVQPRRRDVLAGHVAELARADDVDLVVCAGGAAGDELATRVACRTGGEVMTDVTHVSASADGLRCRRRVYSGHMSAEFASTARPLCVTLEPGSRADWVARPIGHVAPSGRATGPIGHVVLSDASLYAAAAAAPPPFEDADLTAAPSRGDLRDARFLVVAGNGLGGREPVDRLAAAARRLRAAFGVTRPVAMNGWAPPDRLLGVSGARSAPDVCIVAGASGAPAFTWGIERAGLIIAVNPDDHAPIARTADCLVLDDGLAVVEALADLVSTKRSPDRR